MNAATQRQQSGVELELDMRGESVESEDERQLSEAEQIRLRHEQIEGHENDRQHRLSICMSLVSYLPGMQGDYVWSDERVVLPGPGAPRMARNPLPAGIRPADLDDREWRRYKNEVQMLASGGGQEVAVLGQNCIVVDTEFDIDGDVDRYTHKPTLNVPIEILRDEGVDPRTVKVVDEDGAQTLFTAGEDIKRDYYFRGTGEYGEYEDGWLVELDAPARDIDHVLDEHVKPDAVQAAEQEGLEVHRQGDWFFIEQHDEFMPTGISRHPDLEKPGECEFLQNHAAEWLGHDALNPTRTLVKGAVEHLTGDHSTLDLGDDWYEAKHNGVESTSFECEGYDPAERTRANTFSHPESTGRLL